VKWLKRRLGNVDVGKVGSDKTGNVGAGEVVSEKTG
jgi:hypothetical protein